MEIINFVPFNADVWGTVSDWVMVCVTALTARYLWLTLKSQREVQKDQQELTLIEQLNFRQKYLPKFEIRGYAESPSIPSILNFDLVVKNNPIRMLHITTENKGYFAVIHSDVNRVRGPQINPGYSINFNFDLINKMTAPPLRTGYHHKITLSFTDALYNKYDQDIFLIYGSLELQLPFYLENVDPNNGK